MKRILTGILALIASLAMFQGSANAKVAPGCTPDKPSFVGGSIVGYPDNRSLDVHIGVSLGYRDSQNIVHIIADDGGPADPTLAGYSWIEHINPDLPADGSPDTSYTRTWGRCVAANATVFYAEIYPKDAKPQDPGTQTTDKQRYGSSAYYNGAITPGADLDILLRLPVTYEFNPDQGNTGGIQGYITYNGNYVPSTYIGRVRAFPGSGSTCGIEGYSAAADSLLTATDPNRTYYKLTYLAAGQCGAPYQSYSFQVMCKNFCGANVKTYIKRINIVRGVIPRFDVNFT